jgi:hypothetical protein
LCNESTAEEIEKAGLVHMLFHHMGDKKEDDEFVLQITFTCAKLLAFPATARCLMENTEIVHYLVDLLQDTNKEVRSLSHSSTAQALLPLAPTTYFIHCVLPHDCNNVNGFQYPQRIT